MKHTKQVSAEIMAIKCDCGKPWEYEQVTLFEFEKNEYFCKSCYEAIRNASLIEANAVDPKKNRNQVTLL